MDMGVLKVIAALCTFNFGGFDAQDKDFYIEAKNQCMRYYFKCIDHEPGNMAQRIESCIVKAQ